MPLRYLPASFAMLPLGSRGGPAPIDALAKPLAGRDLTREEATRLLETAETMAALLEVASVQRDRAWGRTVTYSRKAFLPVTNLCRDRCTYCTFRKDPDDPDAWTMTPEEIEAWSLRGHALGCKEALMCLGDKPELAFASYRDLLAELGHRTTRPSRSGAASPRGATYRGAPRNRAAPGRRRGWATPPRPGRPPGGARSPAHDPCSTRRRPPPRRGTTRLRATPSSSTRA